MDTDNTIRARKLQLMQLQLQVLISQISWTYPKNEFLVYSPQLKSKHDIRQKKVKKSKAQEAWKQVMNQPFS